MFSEFDVFRVLLAIITNKINDPWKTESEMLVLCDMYFFCFVDHNMKTKRLILWLSTAQTNFEKCHLQEHHFSLVDIPLYPHLKVK